MAATAEWAEIPFVLHSPYDDITFNLTTGDRYLLIPGSCDMGAEVRSTKDDIPQADGSILHHRFFTGYEARMAAMLWVDNAPACDADLVRMIDRLNGVCWSLLNAGDNEGRLSWLPSGLVDYRMLDDVRLSERLAIASPDDGRGTICSWHLDTSFPYAQNLTQQSTALDATITNTGTAEYWPVFRISGGATLFTLTNTTTGLSIVYNSSLPGGIGTGAFGVEIDTFRNTAYLITGSPVGPGDGADAMGSIDMNLSDFWSLATGANACTIVGATGTVLWAPAWA